VKTIHEEYLWLDHAQFSPTDPDLLTYYHEGPLDADHHDPDRLWVTRLGGAFAPRSLRSIVRGNGVSHVLWSPDGTRIFYDYGRWDVPDPPASFLSSTRIDDGASVDVPLQRSEWGLHYNVSHDGTLFASDGGFEQPRILLYRVAGNGTVTVEPLADLSGADILGTQPNVQFTPDGRWVVFRSDFKGSAQVYAVSVERP
jgi:oligogalacturonide lyase